MRPVLRRNLTFLVSRYTHCIKCGASDVHRRATPDRIEPFSTHPVSRLLFLTLAPIYRCATCRIQYRDWRPLRRP
ncbi:MAG: hypothetical protein EXQ59_04020 [Acidobacteria bacterium]|nr:hypothetical protein [Acidobacteriota bacterium]